MSEFQYHEWQTVDRLLSFQEQKEVEKLSSHIEVSASRAVVTYHWSDFKYDPKEVLLDYFDAYLYYANWGTVRLMFRFPRGVVDAEAIAPYCDDEYITFEGHGDYEVLDIHLLPECGQGWMNLEGNLSLFVGLRKDLLAGDYRLLYLAWLASVTLDDERDYIGEDYARVFEPPVPPGLKDISPSLSHFINLTDLDPFLVQAAAEESAGADKGTSIDYAALVSRLPRSECETFLTDLANDKPGVAHLLRQRLQDFLSSKNAQPSTPPRTLAQLKQRAKVLRLAEKRRQKELARQEHIREMEALAKREPQAWEEVEFLLEHGRRIASVYDEVTAKLEKLQQLAKYKKDLPAFQVRVQELARQYGNRSALMRRWKHKGWVK